MSEVISADFTTREDAGISRRRVVAGVAWSLPVIVAAVAAPAAAASGVSVTAGLVGAGSPVTYLPSGGTGGGTNRNGTGPTALQLQNKGGAVNSPITGTINIAPVGTVGAGAGVQSMTPAALASSSYSTTHAYSGSFTYTAGVASGQTLNIPIQLQYESVNPSPKKGVVLSYTLTITVTLPDATTQALTAGLTVTF
ncbi:hypothetical protein [Arthrobacter sp. AFG20]|uniref:hypothetical protein n=1 Tax=Arthrobacter sp. AFG20 TaxID=1688671 RepID=UPI000C9E6927|nr:hypothetical protein [Arthrobacter sp. AFG20]PNH85232.1 hypothetical protein CXZ05_06870 [Arthrobacter sp. AFG20]